MKPPVRALIACCLACWGAAVHDPATSWALPPQDGAGQGLIEPVAVDLGRPVDFTRDIYPILAQNCLACHNVSVKDGGLVADNVAGLLAGGDSGPAVEPGQLDESLLYQYAARIEEPPMPPIPNQVGAAALTGQQLGLLRQWILEGAKPGIHSSRQQPRWQPIPAHVKSIRAVALSPWHRYVAWGRANQLYVYDRISGGPAQQLLDPNLSALTSGGRPMYPRGAAHRDLVQALAFSPDGELLASGGYRVVKLWRRIPAAARADLTLPAGISALSVSDDGKWLAAATLDAQIHVWNLQEDSPPITWTGHSATVSGLLFAGSEARLYSCSLDQTVRCWACPGGALLGQLETPAPIRALALNHDVTRLVTAHADHLLRVWDVAAVQRSAGPAAAAVVAAPLLEIAGHTAPVTAVACIQRGNPQVVSGSEDATVRVWDLQSGQQQLSVDQGGPVTALAVRRDQQVFAAAGLNHVVRLWDFTGKQLADCRGTMSMRRDVLECQDEQTVAGQRLEHARASLNEFQKELNAIDAALKKLRDENKTDASLDEARQKSQAFVEGASARVSELEQAKSAADAALQTAAARAAETEQPFFTIAFTPDGGQLAAGGADRAICLWDAATAEPVAEFAGHEATVRAIAFSPEGSWYSAADDGRIRNWRLESAWQLIGQLGTPPDDPLNTNDSPFQDRVLALDFSPDGRLLATGGGEPSRSGELMLWDVATRTRVREIVDAHSDSVCGVEFSRDGRLLLTGAADRFAKIFDVQSGQQLRSFEGHTHHVLDVSWKADGSSFVSAGGDNVIKYWNVETGDQLQTIGGYAKQVTSVQFPGTGTEIVSCSGDTSVRMHNLPDGGNLRAFVGGADYLVSVAAACDLSIVVAGGEDGVLRIWNGRDGTLVKAMDDGAETIK
ncbi:MAG: hypothetical protein MUF48_22605 [Pirellulaceae bacterium]|nr:hypothetical protein [Pirellulaceae bacterium]